MLLLSHMSSCVIPQVLAMGDILPAGSMRDAAGRLILDWLPVYRKCALLPASEGPQRLFTLYLGVLSCERTEVNLPMLHAGNRPFIDHMAS